MVTKLIILLYFLQLSATHICLLTHYISKHQIKVNLVLYLTYHKQPPPQVHSHRRNTVNALLLFR